MSSKDGECVNEVEPEAEAKVELDSKSIPIESSSTSSALIRSPPPSEAVLPSRKAWTEGPDEDGHTTNTSFIPEECRKVIGYDSIGLLAMGNLHLGNTSSSIMGVSRWPGPQKITACMGVAKSGCFILFLTFINC